MSVRRILSVLTSAALVGATAVAGASSAAAEPDLGDRSLAEALAKDGSGFDSNPSDYDILDNAVAAVLEADPGSPVKVLADGSEPLTAFLPNDEAFRRLTGDLTGTWKGSERAVFTRLAEAAGIEAIESVLLYHVVPGATVDYRAAKKADGAELETALEDATVTVDVRDGKIVLVDGDDDDANARVIKPNLNRGNQQIGHGISRVLRPMDL